MSGAGSGGLGHRGLLRRLVPLIVGVLVVGILAGTAAFIGRASLAEAQSQRLAERERFVDQVAKYANNVYDPDQLGSAVAATAFEPNSPSLNKLLLSEFLASPVGDPVATAALLTKDGKVLLTAPAGRTVPLAAIHDAWTQAIAGTPATSPVFTDDGVPAHADVVPVGGSHPWGVLVQIVHGSAMCGQAFFAKLGALNGKPGGLYTVDRNGIAFDDWDSARLGEKVLPVATVAALPLLKLRHWTEQTPSGPVVWIAERIEQNYTIVFRQTEGDLYGDLRHEQAHRDSILLALLVITVTGLVLSHFLRERGSRRARARLAALLANAQDLVLVVDAAGVLRFVGPSIQALLGLDASEWTGRRFLDVVDPGDVERVRAYLSAPDESTGLLNVRLIGDDGELSWFDLDASDRSDLPEIAGTLVTCHEAGERKRLEDELNRQARHDALTGLANRTVLAERMDALVHQPASLVTVVYVDLDDFKPVNDTLGHDVGDRVLKVAASRLAQLAAETGTGLVARLGGDEFAMLLPGCDEETARGIAARAIWAVREPVVTPMGSARVDASVGVAIGYVGIPQPTGIATPHSDEPLPAEAVVHPEALLRSADQAMYAAKGAGKGSYALRWCHGPKLRPEGALGLANVTTTISGPTAPVEPTAAPDVAPATIEHTARRLGLVRRIRDLAPVLAAVTVLLSLVAVDVNQETAARAHAEAGRRSERIALTVQTAAYASATADPRQLIGPVSAAPWDMTNPLLDTGLAQAVTSTAVGGPGSFVVLADTTGHVVATAGIVTGLPLGPGHAAWTRALQGEPSLAGAIGTAPDVHILYTVPIHENTGTAAERARVMGVLEVGQSITSGIQESLLRTVGSLGMGEGGLSVVDNRGVAMSSYDLNLVGQPLVDPTALTGLKVGQSRLTTDKDGTVTIVSPLASVQNPTPFYQVFRQPASAFYGDIRVGQVLRDASLFLLVTIAVVGLAFAHRRRERTARADSDRLDALLQHAHDVVVVLDAVGSPTFVSSAVQRLLGRSPETLVGDPLAQLVHPADRERFLNWLTTAKGAAGQRSSLQDVRLLDAAGHERWFDIESSDLRGAAEISGLLLTCHDSGARKHLQDQLSFQAHHDMLTGLAHRGVFTNDLDELGTGIGGPGFAVLFIDLDHFKPVNDAFGHAAGDEVLSTVARRLREQSLPGERVYRLGGDEFAVIVTGADKERAGRVADRVLLAIREPFEIGEHGVRIDATIGVALSRGGGEDATTVVREADHAMSQAKQRGRGRYAFATEL